MKAKAPHSLARHLIENSPSKEAYFEAIRLIYSWYRLQLKSWMAHIMENIISNNEYSLGDIHGDMDEVCKRLEKENFPDWLKAWDEVHNPKIEKE